jgi:hypothetical protein
MDGSSVFVDGARGQPDDTNIDLGFRVARTLDGISVWSWE